MLSRFLSKYGAVLAALLVVLFRIPFDATPFFNVDEGVLAAVAGIILDGGVPYAEGWCHRGPVLHYIYAAIFLIFGRGNMHAVHSATTIALALQALMLYRLSTAFFSKRTALLASLLFAFYSTFGFPARSTLGANVDVWVNLWVLPGLLLLLSACRHNRKSHFLWAGILVGMAVLTKQTAVFLYPWLLMTLLVGTHWGKTDSRPLRPYLQIGAMLLTAGMVAPIAAAALWFYLLGALGDFYSLTVAYNFFYIQSFWKQDPASLLWTAATTLKGLVKSFLYPALPQFALPLFGLTWFSIFRSCIRGRFLARFSHLRSSRGGATQSRRMITSPQQKVGEKRGLDPGLTDGRGGMLLFHGWFIAAYFPLIILGRGFGNYFIPLLAAAAVVTSVVLEEIWARFEMQPWNWRHGAAGALLLIPFCHFFYDLPATPTITRNPELMHLAGVVHETAGKDETIFLWGWESQFYTLAERSPASRFVFCSFLTGTSPGGQAESPSAKVEGYRDAIRLWREDLEASRPKVVLDGHLDSHFLRYYPLTRFPGIWDYLQNHYRISERFGNYTLYERND
jgi:hypothetical protein